MAVVDDFGSAAIGGNVEPQLDQMRRRHPEKGVSDDIGQRFLDRQHHLEGDAAIDPVIAAALLDPFDQRRDRGHVRRDGGIVRGHWASYRADGAQAKRDLGGQRGALCGNCGNLRSIASPIACMLTKSRARKHVTGDIMEFTQELAVDMSGLDYISSAGLRVLLVMAKKVQQAKGKVALFGLVPNVREVFSVSGFDTIFSIQPDSATAVAAVR